MFVGFEKSQTFLSANISTSTVVRAQANNPIVWGAMAVVVQNCLMIHMILSPRGEDNSKF